MTYYQPCEMCGEPLPSIAEEHEQHVKQFGYDYQVICFECIPEDTDEAETWSLVQDFRKNT